MEPMRDNRREHQPQIAKYTGPGSGESLVVLEQVVANRKVGGGLGQKLEALRFWLEDDLKAVEAALSAFEAKPEESLDRHAAVPFFKSTGKLLRPVCVLLASRVSGAQTSEAVRDVAVAVELVHSATLLHDDVIDLGNERRGQQTARLIYGNAASVLGGDFVLMRALQLLNQHGDSREMGELLGVIEEMVSAEARQLESRGRLQLDTARYLDVISGKTAALFRWAMGAGGRASGASESVSTALAGYGQNLGMGFQLIDDLLDLMGNSEQLGKDLYVDLAEGKMTFPLIYAANASPAVAEKIQQLLDEPENRDSAEVGHWLAEVLKGTGADEKTRESARDYVNAAIEHLNALPRCAGRTALEEVARTMLRRVC